SQPTRTSLKPHSGTQATLTIDPRFALYQQQPRANKLDARQRRICHIDPAFLEALGVRVNDPRRFAAFLAGMPSYVRLSAPCDRCGGFRRRTRDRSCYMCHLNRGQENFERMKAGLSPKVTQSRDGYLDMLDRQRRERNDEFITKEFGRITLKRYPTGRLEVLYPDGYIERDLNKVSGRDIWRLVEILPELKDALAWAGWF
ncbi:hypothetical protein, partial [Sphingobium yanoikuyae]|uniref:hypothetical protein n=1 Tax=Sphingobium yanoikuyae TaxID=13690 RepID=UPI000262B8FF